ncbi:MAG: helix-hairpin-helix domain-containing protein [Rubrivivax sp.]|jgi:competence protein ComEA|nr:helix-hairpin-helix domain-containing protein [Rubrivivax sp.]
MLRSMLAAALAALALNVFAAVDVNKASQAELEGVKGIGPALSGKILTARKTSDFKDWGDFVDRVAGVGPGNAARFSQAGLTVGGQAYVATTVAKTDKPARGERKAAHKSVHSDGQAAPK